jgi:proline iminopeptidase
MRYIHVCATLAVVVGSASCQSKPAVRRDEPAAAAAAAPDKPVVVQSGPRKIAAGDGVALHVDVAGSGPPCIYVHGGPGQGVQSFQHMRGDALQSFLTMIYVDQRGAGQSASATDYRLDRVVDDLDEVRKALGVEKTYLLGHSFGGILAFRYAEKYPDRVLGVILANATLWFPGSMRSQVAYIREQIGDTGRTPDDASWDQIEADYLAVRQKLWAKKEYVPLLAEDIGTMRALRQVDSDPPRNQELGSYVIRDPRARGDYDADFTQRTPGVKARVLVIIGDRDHAVGPDHYKLFRFPNQTVERIDGSHLLYYENSDAFAAAIRGWVAAGS